MKLPVSGSFYRCAAVAALALGAGAQGAVFVYSANLSGPNEAPPNASPGTGFTTVTVNTSTNTMRVEASFAGLLGNTTACHIHAATAVPGTGTAGVATQTPSFFGFPLGVTAGVMDQTFDMTLASSFNGTYINNNGGTVASARAALFGAIDGGRAYLNIHSATFPGGEIRGFLTLVPAPGAAGLLALASLAGLKRRRA